MVEGEERRIIIKILVIVMVKMAELHLLVFYKALYKQLVVKVVLYLAFHLLVASDLGQLEQRVLLAEHQRNPQPLLVARVPAPWVGPVDIGTVHLRARRLGVVAQLMLLILLEEITDQFLAAEAVVMLSILFLPMSEIL